MAKKLTDAQVAEFLVDFRERKPEEQERSVVWQELVSFPQWGMAKFVPDKVKPIEPTPGNDPSLPDPRLSATARAEITKAKDEQRPPTAVGTKVSGNTIKTSGGTVNPWADYSPPPAEGSVSYGIRTEIHPPASFGDPARWRRDENGWHRKA